MGRGIQLSIILDTLCGQFGDNVVEVVWVGVAMSTFVGDARLVVDLVPDDTVRLAGGRRSSDGERKSASPRLHQQLQHLNTNAQHLLFTHGYHSPD